jgi:ABC-2 type transport system permease protein
VLDYNFATLDQLFIMAPFIFLFLIPAITMRSFAEEKQSGTIEFLATKPISDLEIVGGKFLANFILVLFALIPTLIYYFSVYNLGSPVGNLDSGAIFGSYIGLFFLSAAFVSIGLLASVLSQNQIVAFILGSFLCFIFHWAFTFLANLPLFYGSAEQFVQKLGINYHYSSISKGALHSSDIIYFLSIIFLFLYVCKIVFSNRK